MPIKVINWLHGYPGRMFLQGHQLATRISRAHVSSWAEFLCQKSVTFGLLHATREPGDDSVSLKLRGVPSLSILTFGPIQERSSQVHFASAKSLEGGKDGHAFVRSFQIPIQKSWLSLAGPKGDRGCLVFDFTFHDCYDKEVGNDQAFCELETRIDGYRPWVVGYPPSGRLRRALYLGVQSRLHA